MSMRYEQGEGTNRIEAIKHRYSEIYTIVSPPRCASTALARAFWQQPSIGYYAHEPFERTYYEHAPIEDALASVESPIDLGKMYGGKDMTQGNALLIKEMPYQVGENFSILLEMTTKPPIFLIRDPRLNIMSRIQKKREGGQSIDFPLIETGWELLFQQTRFCEQRKRDYSIVDATDFRENPDKILANLFLSLDLPYNQSMLTWGSAENINLDNLGGAHSHLYKRVLKSTGIEAPTEHIPKIDEFPEISGLQQHVLEAMEIYKILKKSKNRIKI